MVRVRGEVDLVNLAQLEQVIAEQIADSPNRSSST